MKKLGLAALFIFALCQIGNATTLGSSTQSHTGNNGGDYINASIVPIIWIR